MVSEYISYGGGIVISQKVIDKISEEFIHIIKEELPEEARNITVIDDILSSAKSKIYLKALKL